MAENRAVEVGRALAKLPTPDSADTGEANPAAISARLREAIHYATMLMVFVDRDDTDSFLDQHEKLRSRLADLEPQIQSIRYSLAQKLAVDEGVQVEWGDEQHSSGHLALFEWCRHVFYTMWAATDIERVEAEWPERPAFSGDEVTESWASIKAACKAMPVHNFSGMDTTLDAELGLLLEGRKPSPPMTRDEWIAQLRDKDYSLSEIRRELRQHPEWDQISTDQGISAVLKRMKDR